MAESDKDKIGQKTPTPKSGGHTGPKTDPHVKRDADKSSSGQGRPQSR